MSYGGLHQHHGRLRDIDESAADAYEQLRALLVSRYTRPTGPGFRVVKIPGDRRHEAN
jgi:hypothetical protein